MAVKNIGSGKVVLIAGGGKIYTDIAARFVRSERKLEDIIASPYSKKIVKNIINSGHEAATEFDYFLFGIEGYSRVTEAQLIRKRLASYLIKSGRIEHDGKREFNTIIPESIEEHTMYANLYADEVLFDDGRTLEDIMDFSSDIKLKVNFEILLNLIEEWYNDGVNKGIPEEDLRYLKPQATEFKAIIGMNAHALRDWFMIRCCLNSQSEIRDLANKMLKICKDTAPDLFQDAGPSCKRLGYCPENDFQNEKCKGKIVKKDRAIEILQNYTN